MVTFNHSIADNRTDADDRGPMTDDSEPGADDTESVVSPTFIVGSICLAVAVILASLTTLVVLNKCTKIVYQVRFASINLTFANLLYGLTIITSSTYSAIHGRFCVALLKLLPFCFTTYYLFLTAIGLGRLLSLKLAFKYTFWTNRKKAYIAALGMYCIALLLAIPNMTENGGKITCQGHPRDMFTDKGIIVYSFSILTLLLVQSITYGYIGFSAVNRYYNSTEISSEGLRKVRQVFKGYWKVTLKSFHLCIMSAVLIGPFIFSRIVEAVTRDLDGDNVHVHPVTYFTLVTTFLHQIASPMFTLITYKECRYTFLRMVNHFDKEKKRKLESEYKQYYATYGISVVTETVQ